MTVILFSFASLSRIENISIKVITQRQQLVEGAASNHRVYYKILNSVKYKSRDK